MTFSLAPPSHGPISTRTRGNTSRLTMMGLADTAAAAIGLPVDQFLYLSCMLAAYPLGFAFALIPFRYRSARHALAGSLGLAFAVVTLVCRRRGLGVGLVGSFAPLLREVDRSFRNAESRRSSHLYRDHGSQGTWGWTHSVGTAAAAYVLLLVLPRSSSHIAVFVSLMVYLSGSHIYRMWTDRMAFAIPRLCVFSPPPFDCPPCAG